MGEVPGWDPGSPEDTVASARDVSPHPVESSGQGGEAWGLISHSHFLSLSFEVLGSAGVCVGRGCRTRAGPCFQGHRNTARR